MKRIVATFHPQAWQNDYAIPADPNGPVTADVTEDFLARYNDDEIAGMRDDSYDSDEIRELPNAPQWWKDWSGPFWIEIRQSLDEYFA